MVECGLVKVGLGYFVEWVVEDLELRYEEFVGWLVVWWWW